MANLQTAKERAENIGAGARKEAAHHYNSVNHELEHGDYSFEEAAPGEDALQVLRNRFPGIEDDAAELERPPSLSRRASENIERTDPEHAGRRRRSAPSSSSSSTRSSGSSRQAAGSRTARRAGGHIAAGRVFERASGVKSGDAADAVIGGLRFLLIAGIVYQVLQPKGSRAFATALGGLAKGYHAIVDPVDPFVALGGRVHPVAAVAPSPTPITALANANLQNPFPNEIVPVQTPARPGPESSTGVAPSGPNANPLLNPLAPIFPRAPSPFRPGARVTPRPINPLAGVEGSLSQIGNTLAMRFG